MHTTAALPAGVLGGQGPRGNAAHAKMRPTRKHTPARHARDRGGGRARATRECSQRQNRAAHARARACAVVKGAGRCTIRGSKKPGRSEGRDRRAATAAKGTTAEQDF